MSIDTEQQRFLVQHGFGHARVEPVAGDASSRRFLRIVSPHRSAVLIVSTPDGSDTVAFARISGMLRGLGLSAPEIYAVDATNGLILAEDFGDDCLGRMVQAGADPCPFCFDAVDVLVALHQRFDASAAGAGLTEFAPALFLDQLLLFLDSYLPVVQASAGELTRAAFHAAWAGILPHAYRVPRSLLLRDYHLGNLMRLPGREGVLACGILDFQDAGLGPITYDLVSLLEDPRLPTDPCAAPGFARYLAAVPALDPVDFTSSCAILSAMRQCRILGIFARLATEQDKPGYLRFMPRVWQLLERRLAEPALAPVAAWFAAHLPANKRIPAAFTSRSG